MATPPWLRPAGTPAPTDAFDPPAGEPEATSAPGPDAEPAAHGHDGAARTRIRIGADGIGSPAAPVTEGDSRTGGAVDSGGDRADGDRPVASGRGEVLGRDRFRADGLHRDRAPDEGARVDPAAVETGGASGDGGPGRGARPRPATRPARPQRPARTRRPGWSVLVAAGCALFVVCGALGFVVAGGAADDAEAGAAGGGSGGGCPAVTEPDHVVGDGPGDHRSPLGAVLAFDHAYYVERSVDRVFEAVAPGSRLDRDRVRSEGIDRLAPGTTHCVDARLVGGDRASVTLTQTAPGEDPLVIRQDVALARQADGRWGVLSIAPAR